MAKLKMMVWGARWVYMSLSYEGGSDGQRTWVMIPQAGKGAMEDLERNTGQPLQIIAIHEKAVTDEKSKNMRSCHVASPVYRRNKTVALFILPMCLLP